MSIMHVSLPARTTAANALAALVDAGTGPGTIKFYAGSMPADADTAVVAQVLLATLTFSATAFSAAVDGTATALEITSDTSADATGEATWARVADGDGNVIFDCDVGPAGGVTTITLGDVNIVEAGTVLLTSFTLTAPAS